MTPQSLTRVEIARRVSDAHLPIGLAASFITGSAADGIADDASDIDMSLFFEGQIPPESELIRVREQLDPNPPKWALGSHEDGEMLYAIRMYEIEVQYGLGTVAGMQTYVDDVIDGKYLRGPEQKIAMGTLLAIAFAGEELVQGWKEQFANYPDALRVKMIEAHRPPRQIGELYPKIAERDAELWTRRELTDLAYNIIGMLAGHNRRWHSDFQLKKMRRFCDGLAEKPDRLSDRLIFMANGPLPEAVREGQALLDETLALIDGPKA